MHAATVLRQVRLALGGWPAIELAAESEPFRSDEECRAMVRAAQQHMRRPARRHLAADVRVRYDVQTLVQLGGTMPKGCHIVAMKIAAVRYRESNISLNTMHRYWERKYFF